MLVLAGCSGNQENLISFQGDDSRTVLLFDDEWKFFRGDTSDAETMDFDDASWRVLDLPHDWSIEDLPGKNNPVDSNAAGGLDAGYLVGGTGWYRKSFRLPDNLEDRKFQLQFDGIYMNSDVWLNGEHLGNHPYGYTSFRYDITDKLIKGKTNILAVKVRNEGHNSRWYSGSGIYRHVWLTVTNPLHLDPWWNFVHSSVMNDSATIHIETSVFNESGEEEEIVLVSSVLDKAGNESAKSESRQKVAANRNIGLSNNLDLKSPELWSTDNPVLYTVINELYTVASDGTMKLMDRLECTTGVRSVEINANEGFLLNGKPLELKGACMHHDNGPLGAAAFDRAEERRVELMKEAGFNAIRCSHNPPSTAFLDACDRLGMLVIDESFDMWAEPKNPDDYHLYFRDWWQRDVESMVRRDRNHPSIVMWSIGNEIPERGKPEGAELAAMQVSFIRQLDTTQENYFCSQQPRPG